MITEISTTSSVAVAVSDDASSEVSPSTDSESSLASEVESELEQPTVPSKRQVAIIDLVKIECLVMNQKRSQDQVRSTLVGRQFLPR
jgi:hypothetical protein